MDETTLNQNANAIDMLIADHKKVDQLFKQFKKIKDNASDSEKLELVKQICLELTIHTQLEEEIFYPAVRKEIQDEDLMDEALVEHGEAKGIIAQLFELQPGDDLYDARVIVLSENIEHHVEEEQDEMFPKVRKTGIDLNALGAQMMERKTELQGEYEDQLPQLNPISKSKSTSNRARAS